MPTHIRTPILIAPTSLKVYILDFRPEFWKGTWSKLPMILLCRQKAVVTGVSKRGGPAVIAFVVGFCGLDSIERSRSSLAAPLSKSVGSSSEGRRVTGVCTRERVVSAHVARADSDLVICAQSRHSVPRSTGLADAASEREQKISPALASITSTQDSKPTITIVSRQWQYFELF